ncbi:hypothetical protein OG455_01560 [Kitasatospora sp. NBC_01287]|uniref:hypothetical protein n=1 Tax=Kitasatospora sp. NBC_01287 TaxID=2903573 RepID=UPI00224F6CBC|nr:hypothetical protein [Kitasatospora sp. NBC_01287]MCX4744212.1 hypothetical protein [Kitasatospora sp. NBC_01287]
MNDPEHPGPLPVTRDHWLLVHPLLAALSEAGVPLRYGDLDQLQNAAHLGPDFVHALARWLRAAHAPPTTIVARVVEPPDAVPRLLAPPRALGGAASARPRAATEDRRAS